MAPKYERCKKCWSALKTPHGEFCPRHQPRRQATMLALVVILALCMPFLASALTGEITYAGIGITNSTGALLNGSQNVTTKVFLQESGGAAQVTDNRNVTFTNGRFVLSFNWTQATFYDSFWIEANITGVLQSRFKYTASAQSLYTNQSNRSDYWDGLDTPASITGTLGINISGSAAQLGNQPPPYFLNGTGFDAGNVTSGTILAARLSGQYLINISGNSSSANTLQGNPSSFFLNQTGFAAENLTSGTVADARLASTLTRDAEWDTIGEVETIWGLTVCRTTGTNCPPFGSGNSNVSRFSSPNNSVVIAFNSTDVNLSVNITHLVADLNLSLNETPLINTVNTTTDTAWRANATAQLSLILANTGNITNLNTSAGNANTAISNLQSVNTSLNASITTLNAAITSLPNLTLANVNTNMGNLSAVNSTLARVGTCPAGQFANGTNTSGVMCGAPPSNTGITNGSDANLATLNVTTKLNVGSTNLTTTLVTEGTNQYYTDARVVAAIQNGTLLRNGTDASFRNLTVTANESVAGEIRALNVTVTGQANFQSPPAACSANFFMISWAGSNSTCVSLNQSFYNVNLFNGTLNVTHGGTGITTYTTGDLLTGNATGGLDVVAAGASALVLTSNGAGTKPTWQAGAAGSNTGWTLNTTTDITWANHNVTINGSATPTLCLNDTVDAKQWCFKVTNSGANLDVIGPAGAVVFRGDNNANGGISQNFVSTSSYNGATAGEFTGASSGQSVDIFHVKNGTNQLVLVVNATGGVQVNQSLDAVTLKRGGVNVCTSDGTNCPASGGSGGGWVNDSNTVTLVSNSTNVSIGNYSGSVPILFVDSTSGRVGVNTKTPQYNFTVLGSGNYSGAYINATGIFLGNGQTTAIWQNGIGIGTISGSSIVGSTGDLKFAISCTYGSTCSSVRMTISSSNSFVYIGSSGTTPTQRLHVDGGLNVTAGNITIGRAGDTLRIANGTNACAGSATLSGGTVNVPTNCMLGNQSHVLIADETVGALTNVGAIVTSNRTFGQFVLTSTNALDASTVHWEIHHDQT